MEFPPEVIECLRVFQEAGKQCFIVGGALRDAILGQPLHDFDLATNARPEEVFKLFKRVIPTGILHGTVTVLYKKFAFEVTTFRSDADYSNSRHPDRVSFGHSIEEDLSRRDFTINALAYDPFTNRLIDLFAGRSDLEKKIIRTVGDAHERFNEDALRPLRAIRFASQLGFTIESTTLAAISDTREKFSHLSIERVRDEFQKILLTKKPSVALHLLEETGLLKLFLPELSACVGVTQSGGHLFPVFEHILHSVDASPPELHIRLATLFHDIAKPLTQGKGEKAGEEKVTFYNHEVIGQKLTADILRRLRFPNVVIDEVSHLVGQHMFHYEENWSDAAVRRFIKRVGSEHLDALFKLRLADSSGKTASPVSKVTLEPLQKRIAKIQASGNALRLQDLAIKGDDLKAAGYPAGPEYGRILNTLLEHVLDQPEANNKENLLRVTQENFGHLKK